ncbi:MAG: hypothetical protein V7634_4058 [Bradyrhizobium sp.]|jgi:hypothetical protein
MLKEGTYAAWFKTPAGEGTGVAHLENGNVTGGDDILSYSGTYETDGDRFTAVIRTKRHSPGRSTIFGFDDLTLRLEGRWSSDALARCSGQADEVPHAFFEATLMLSRPEDPKPEPVITEYHPERLPSLSARQV